MELPSKILEKIAFFTRSKIDEHILIAMDKSTHEKHYLKHCKLITNNLKLQLLF